MGLFSETRKLELRFNPPGTAGFRLPPSRGDEERILLELVCEHGYGEWRKIKDFGLDPGPVHWFLKWLDPGTDR